MSYEKDASDPDTIVPENEERRSAVARTEAWTCIMVYCIAEKKRRTITMGKELTVRTKDKCNRL